MTRFEQLEGLNPVPDTRGNPGVLVTARRRRRSRGAAVLAVAAATTAIVLGGLAIGGQRGVPVDLAVAGQPSVDVGTPTPQPSPTPISSAPSQLSEEADDARPTAVSDSAQSAAFARLIIPTIDVDELVGGGVSAGALRSGPGLYPESGMPGQAGNARIAALGAAADSPFYRLDELTEGASIFVFTVQGTFEYVVREQTVRGVGETDVLQGAGDDRLTLTTRGPEHSLEQRLVVVADLVGEPAAPLAIRGLPLQGATTALDENETPLLGEGSMRNGQPYFSFIGDGDAERSARGFLTSQFPGWGGTVDLSLALDTNDVATVRWVDAANGTAGWVFLFWGDGVYNVWEMTMDGVDARLYTTSEGGRGFASSETLGQTLEVLRPVPFSMTAERDPFSWRSQSTEPLAVAELAGGPPPGALVRFEVTRIDTFQEVRMMVRNEAGEQVGGVASSLSLPLVDEIAVITDAGESDELRQLLDNQAEVIGGPIGWDRWQSVYFLSWLAPERSPNSVEEIPTHEVTTFALRPVTSTEEYSAQLALLDAVESLGAVIWVPEPRPGAALPEQGPDFADTPPADGYVIDELPSVDICRGMRMIGWSRPEVWVNEDRQVFATPEQARDSAPETAVGHTVEFRTTDGVVSGFARTAPDYPWRFLSLAVVEQVEDGWVLDRWEQATC